MGPMRIGNYLELREDIYSIAYLYQMRRVWTKGLPSESELEEKRDDDPAY